jgi:pimeloyl-ACP methyl ester carboxylesterase
VIDSPAIVNMMFYPRTAFTPLPMNAFDMRVAVDNNVEIALRWHILGPDKPSILFFHGTGEVIYDYDTVSPLFKDSGSNLILADYRGYGSSGGTPSFKNVVHDAQVILRSVQQELDKRGFLKELWIMGRSLGSLSALELAANYPDQAKGLIIESGFANVTKVMKHLGFFPEGIPLERFDQECIDMVKRITIPTLIIHGDIDQIVPYEEALDIYNNLGSAEKKMITITHAGHNDIMYVGLREYFTELESFIKGDK